MRFLVGYLRYHRPRSRAMVVSKMLAVLLTIAALSAAAPGYAASNPSGDQLTVRGVYQASCTDVQGTVFNDANLNQIQDAGEGGIQDVRLVARNLETGDAIKKTRTAGDGKYVLSSLAEGQRLIIVKPNKKLYTNTTPKKAKVTLPPCSVFNVGLVSKAQPGPTPTPTATPSPLTSQPCPAGMHDPTKWHALVDPATGCHYNHEHKDDPHLVDDIFGPVAKYPGQEISFPWLTGNGTENTLKHESYGWLVRRNLPAKGSASEDDGFVKALRLQAHMDFHAQGVPTRFHSYWLEAQICVKAQPNDCGIVRLGGQADFEELRVDGAHVPLPADPNVSEQVLRKSIAQRIHYSTHGPNVNRAEWYGTRKNATYDASGNPVSPWGGPFRYVTFTLASDDAWQTIDPKNPTAVNLICPDFQCKFNGSTATLFHLVLLPRTPMPERFRDSTGHATWSGFSDRYGNEVAPCAPLGPDCIPFVVEHLPKVKNVTYSDGRAGIPVKDYDTSPAATGKGKEWWIQYPN